MDDRMDIDTPTPVDPRLTGNPFLAVVMGENRDGRKDMTIAEGRGRGRHPSAVRFENGSDDENMDMADGQGQHPGAIHFENGEDEDDGGEDDVESDISEADSDYVQWKADCARHDAQRDAFLSQHRGEMPVAPQPKPLSTTPAGKAGPGTGAGVKPKRKGRKLGPRKAAKPTPDILFRLSLARDAFERKDYEEAINMLGEIIRINSETYNAWTMLSTVHEELGDHEKATICLMTAAHLVPKNVTNWVSTALYALSGVEDMEDGPQKEEALNRALTCYSCALVVDKTNIEASTGKADVLMMQGKAGRALTQYQKALSYRPLNIRTIRNLADVALDLKDSKKGAEIARAAYRHLIDHLQNSSTVEAEEGRFEWSDLRIYIEFFTTLETWQEGAQQLKQISRWLLGRNAESFWDQWVDDDREWDLHDDRRIEVPEFVPAQYPQDTYGQGLPVDL